MAVLMAFRSQGCLWAMQCPVGSSVLLLRSKTALCANWCGLILPGTRKKWRKLTKPV